MTVKTFALHLMLALCIGFAGCATNDPASGSPTAALFRGDIEPDQYLDRVREANEQSREAEQFEVNKEPTRAYNTVSGKVEYVPQDSQQKWNEENQRWEFTPVQKRGED